MNFDLHIHTDRRGRTCVAVTDPCNQRSRPVPLSLHGAIDLAKLLRAVVGEHALEWLGGPSEPAQVRPDGGPDI